MLFFLTDTPKKEKLQLMAKMLEGGANPNLLNKNGENFLSTLKKLPDEWFEEHLMVNEKLRGILIEKGNDASLSFIFDKFRELNPEGDNQIHPIHLAREIFEKRELLKNSFQKLLVWEGEHHRNDSNEIRKCCYNEVDAKKAYIIHHELEQVITKRLKGSYYVVQAFNSMFLIFLSVKSVDFLTDLTMNYKFYNPEDDDIFKNLPNASTCKENKDAGSMEHTIACYFREMNDWILFVSCLSIFVLNYSADAIFVMTDKSARHYKAIMAGYCCWKAVPKSGTRSKLLKFYWHFFLPLINQMAIYVYGFWVRTFGTFWRKQMLKMSMIKRKSFDEVDSSKKKKCKAEPENPNCFRNITDREIETFDKMQDQCDKTVTVGKIVTSSTENSFMPLLQLSILFPNFISLFPSEQASDDSSKEGTWEIHKLIGKKFPFALATIITSIIFSLASMGIALTETYFSKSGRKTYKTPGKWALYFSSIIFQVVPKIFAYQIFAFGFIPIVGEYLVPEYGPNFIIPTLLLLPLVLSFFRASVFFCTFYGKESTKTFGEKARESMLFGLATMFVCMENNFQYQNNSSLNTGVAQYSQRRRDIENQNGVEYEQVQLRPNVKEEKQKRGKVWRSFEKIHLVHDVTSFILTLTMTALGAYHIHALLDRVLFTVVITEMQLLGLILKNTYYLHVHPWEKLNQRHKTYVKCHKLFTGIYIVGFLVTVIYYAWKMPTIGFFTLALLLLFFPIALVSSF